MIGAVYQLNNDSPLPAPQAAPKESDRFLEP